MLPWKSVNGEVQHSSINSLIFFLDDWLLQPPTFMNRILSYYYLNKGYKSNYQQKVWIKSSTMTCAQNAEYVLIPTFSLVNIDCDINDWNW